MELLPVRICPAKMATKDQSRNVARLPSTLKLCSMILEFSE